MVPKTVEQFRVNSDPKGCYINCDIVCFEPKFKEVKKEETYEPPEHDHTGNWKNEDSSEDQESKSEESDSETKVKEE